MTAGLVALALYAVVAAGVAGALLERERLLNPDGERGWRWVGGLVLCVVFWPVVGLLWPESRPAPTPPPRSGRPMFTNLDIRSTWEWVGPRGEALPEEQASAYRGHGPAVAHPRELAHLFPRVVAAYVLSHRVAVGRTADDLWRATTCSCVWNNQGWPQVVCRTHQDDPVLLPEEVAWCESLAMLAVWGGQPNGTRVAVRDLGVTMKRETTSVWRSMSCACAANGRGEQIVTCRKHRTDTDPQGEPDEDDEVEP